jgi:hypothetical protein
MPQILPFSSESESSTKFLQSVESGYANYLASVLFRCLSYLFSVYYLCQTVHICITVSTFSGGMLGNGPPSGGPQGGGMLGSGPPMMGAGPPMMGAGPPMMGSGPPMMGAGPPGGMPFGGPPGMPPFGGPRGPFPGGMPPWGMPGGLPPPWMNQVTYRYLVPRIRIPFRTLFKEYGQRLPFSPCKDSRLEANGSLNQGLLRDVVYLG